MEGHCLGRDFPAFGVSLIKPSTDLEDSLPSESRFGVGRLLDGMAWWGKDKLGNPREKSINKSPSLYFWG